MSPATVKEVLERCSNTGSWAGEPIRSLDQRNFLNDTPLHTVCTWGEIEPVRLLLVAGADINAKGDSGNTPLFNAIMSERPELVAFMLESGADPLIGNDDGKRPSRFARNVGPVEIAELLERAENKRGRSRSH